MTAAAVTATTMPVLRPFSRLYLLIVYEASTGLAVGWHAFSIDATQLIAARDAYRKDPARAQFMFEVVPYACIAGLG